MLLSVVLMQRNCNSLSGSLALVGPVQTPDLVNKSLAVVPYLLGEPPFPAFGFLFGCLKGEQNLNMFLLPVNLRVNLMQDTHTPASVDGPVPVSVLALRERTAKCLVEQFKILRIVPSDPKDRAILIAVRND